MSAFLEAAWEKFELIAERIHSRPAVSDYRTCSIEDLRLDTLVATLVKADRDLQAFNDEFLEKYENNSIDAETVINVMECPQILEPVQLKSLCRSILQENSRDRLTDLIVSASPYNPKAEREMRAYLYRGKDAMVYKDGFKPRTGLDWKLYEYECFYKNTVTNVPALATIWHHDFEGK